MNSFHQAGEAMLHAQEGNRLIAQAIVRGLGRLAQRLAHAFVTAFSTAPGTR